MKKLKRTGDDGVATEMLIERGKTVCLKVT